jgi:hypothetical protein
MIGVVLQLLLYAFKACVGTAWSSNSPIQRNRVIYGEAERGLAGQNSLSFMESEVPL